MRVQEIMWERDCGIVPVVDEGGKVVGMISDRDIGIALATRGRPAGQLLAREVPTGRLFTCSPDDTVQVALSTMQDAKARRLAVVDASGACKASFRSTTSSFRRRTFAATGHASRTSRPWAR